MAVAIVLGLVPAVFAGTTLQVKSRPLRESAHLKYSSADALAGLAKGAGTGTGTISAQVFVRQDGVMTGYTIPAGSHDGTAGWIVNDAKRALFANRGAPGGPTGVSRTVFATGRRVRLTAKSLGDLTPLALTGAPTDTVRVAYVVTNGAETSTHCTQFAPGTCTFTPLDAGTGWRLRCRDGVADLACGARPSCGNGVREIGEECDGGPLCSAACEQGLSSCCEHEGQCVNSVPYVFTTNLIRQCQASLHQMATPRSGMVCGAGGACEDQPIEPVSVCCQQTESTCFDSVRSSLVDLFIARQQCTVTDFTMVRYNSVCTPSGACVAQ